MIVSIENKLSLGKGFPRSMATRLKFGTFLEASFLGPSRLNAMTRFLIMNNDMKQVPNTTFGTSSSYMPRRCENVFSSTSRLAFSRRWVFSKASLIHVVRGTYFVENTTSTLSGIGRNIIILDR